MSSSFAAHRCSASGVGALTCFLQRLLVRIGEVPELRLELGLQLRPDAVNDAANLFLGH